jgi:hypothetical protein
VQGFSIGTDAAVSLDPSGGTEWFVCNDSGVLTVLLPFPCIAIPFRWWFSRVWGGGRGRRVVGILGGWGDWADGRFIMDRRRVKILPKIVVPLTFSSLVTSTKTVNPFDIVHKNDAFGGIRCGFCGDGSLVFGVFLFCVLRERGRGI